MKPVRVRSKRVLFQAMQYDGTRDCADAIAKWLTEYDVRWGAEIDGLQLTRKDHDWHPIFVIRNEWIVVDTVVKTVSVYDIEAFARDWEFVR